MDGHNLGRIDAVLGDDDVPGQVADGDDLVSHFHTPLLYGEDAGVDVVRASAVERGGVHVDYQRLAGHLLGSDSGRICEPVVGVDEVELTLVLLGYGSAHHRIACDFLHEVGAVLARELVFLAVLEAEILHLTLPLLLHVRVEVDRIHIRDEVAVDMEEPYLVEELIHGETFPV